MNNDLEWEKVLQWTHNETTYLIHIITDQHQISIEVEDKYSGDIWESLYSSTGIQELTAKARNPKKYSVFTKMLISALMKTTDSLTAEILSYRQMNSKFGKPGSQSKVITQQQASKRFLLLTYVGEFQKMQFPLPLMYCPDVGSERLKLTIKRLSQEMQMMRQGQSEDEALKENSLLKYENQSLKGKLKNSSKLDSSSFLQPKVEELNKQISDKNALVVTLQDKLNEFQKSQKESDLKLKQSEEKVAELEELIKAMQGQQTDKGKTKKKMDYYEKKIQEMINEMSDLSADLMYSRQKEKKAQLKVSTLQKQLEKMMSSKKTKPKTIAINFRDSSPDDKRSQKSLSVKSGRSNASMKNLSRTKNMNRKTYNTFGQPSQLNNSNSKKNLSNRKSSVYDSDTESSRMRRMANPRSSPFRPSVGVNNNKVKKTNNNQRSRSRSKERRTSPKPLAVESQLMTEGFQSDSSQDSDYNQIDSYLRTLKEKKGVKNTGKAKPLGHNAGSKLQNRLQTLEQMIKKTAQATRLKH